MATGLGAAQGTAIRNLVTNNVDITTAAIIESMTDSEKNGNVRITLRYGGDRGTPNDATDDVTKDYVVPTTFSHSIAQGIIMHSISEDIFRQITDTYVPATIPNGYIKIATAVSQLPGYTDPDLLPNSGDEFIDDPSTTLVEHGAITFTDAELAAIASKAVITATYKIEPGGDDTTVTFVIHAAYMGVERDIELTHTYPKSINQEILDKLSISDFGLLIDTMMLPAPATLTADDFDPERCPDGVTISGVRYNSVVPSRDSANVTLTVTLGKATRDITGDMAFNVRDAKLYLASMTGANVKLVDDMDSATAGNQQVATTDIDVEDLQMDLSALNAKLIAAIPGLGSTFNAADALQILSVTVPQSEIDKFTNDTKDVQADVVIQTRDRFAAGPDNVLDESHGGPKGSVSTDDIENPDRPTERIRTIRVTLHFAESINEHTLAQIDTSKVGLSYGADGQPGI